MLVQGVRAATRPALWRRVGPAGWLLAFLLAASLVGSLALESPDAQSLAQALNPPSVDHPFGTDLKGRDLLARDARGLLLSIRIGLAAAVVASVLGVAVGLLAGYAGGRIDRTLMRAVDVMYGLPYIVFVVVLMVVFGRSELNLFLAIGLTSWLTMARIVRAEVRTVRALPYVEAARALGAGHLRIAALHVLPNVAGTALVYGALIVPAAIRQEALLSFLGLGVAPPAASLGSLLREGLSALSPLQNTAWLLWVPALTLLALVWSLNGVADRLRDRMDPRKGR
jgi:oligopeptide transport system permease protein